MSARSIVELPGDLHGDYEVYLNGVHQQAYVDRSPPPGERLLLPSVSESQADSHPNKARSLARLSAVTHL